MHAKVLHQDRNCSLISSDSGEEWSSQVPGGSDENDFKMEMNIFLRIMRHLAHWTEYEMKNW